MSFLRLPSGISEVIEAKTALHRVVTCQKWKVVFEVLMQETHASGLGTMAYLSHRL